MKGFESGQSSKDLSRVPACMAHVKTGEDDVLKKVRLWFLKSGGCQAPLYSLAGWGQGAAWKGLEGQGQQEVTVEAQDGRIERI